MILAIYPPQKKNLNVKRRTQEKESKCQKENPYKEIPIKLFVFLIIGYIINFLACIVVIICFCLNTDIVKYVAIAGLAEFVILGCFDVII